METMSQKNFDSHQKSLIILEDSNSIDLVTITKILPRNEVWTQQYKHSYIYKKQYI